MTTQQMNGDRASEMIGVKAVAPVVAATRRSQQFVGEPFEQRVAEAQLRQELDPVSIDAKNLLGAVHRSSA